MSHMSDRESYLARAAEARAAAEETTLANVRDRCLRAEAAWIEMAARADRTQAMRDTLLAEKAKAAEAVQSHSATSERELSEDR